MTKIRILAVGKLKKGPLHTLYETYQQRLQWPILVEEIEGYGKHEPHTQKTRETQALLLKVPKDAIPIFLDRQGEALSSIAFADFLEKMFLIHQHPTFMIGGSEGLDASYFPEKHHCLSFGPATWPHLLARVMLMEQLYRAQEILGGGKYHRA